MKPLAAALAGLVLGAGVMTAGTAMAPDTDSERIGILEERVAYLEAAQADQGAREDSTAAWLRRCIRTEPARWARIGGRMVLVAADERQVRLQVATLLQRCLSAP